MEQYEENYVLVLEQKIEQGIPSVITLVPLGNVETTQGSFIVNTESFQSMNQQFKKRKIDVVIDYEHQTLQDVQSPAAGWIKSLSLSKDAILGVVEWTQKAQEYLKNKEYKYLSPVIQVRKEDGVAVGLHSVALTNTPAINGMKALVLKNNETNRNFCLSSKHHQSFLEELATEMGLKIDDVMDDEEIVNLMMQEIKKQKGSQQSKSDVLEEEKGNREDWKAKYEELKNQINKKEADELVIKALKEGKISKFQKEWAEEYALKDKQFFEKFLEKAPQVVPMGEIEILDRSRENIAISLKYDTKSDELLGVLREDKKKYEKIML